MQLQVASVYSVDNDNVRQKNKTMCALATNISKWEVLEQQAKRLRFNGNAHAVFI